MAAMTPEQRCLVQRVRDLVADEPDVREVSMFGGRAIMVNDKMIVSIGKSGDLLVRTDAEHHEALLAEPGAEQAQMGAGRDMGPGWITVAPETIADDEHLTFWVDAAMSHNRVITGRESRSKRGTQRS
ncbi:TfoX/Sxy family protein [Actinomyces sp. ZJ308]|uniref:TfoX/Sxy family protein n=1 Tax=Actinomyces sp. ZJ308 TaxID=2708342 RepID=UPI001422991F|nr:TfoX/Sxy family protein [Actinomyces sp. ZJ308]